jgi:hypothetical protein
LEVDQIGRFVTGIRRRLHDGRNQRRVGVHGAVG